MPAYIISQSALEYNAEILKSVAQNADCKIVLALKGFSTWGCFDIIRPYLSGCCASGLWEASLAREFFGKEILTYSPAYEPEDITELIEFTSHLDFNSLGQWNTYRDQIMSHPRFIKGELHCGLRINPQHSTGHTELYDPCAPGSRLGIIADRLLNADLTGISGFHFHTLCEQGSEDLQSTLAAVEARFGELLKRPEISWVNMGGGHWITKPDYNRDLLIQLIRDFKKKYDVNVWLEPGEAVAIHTGVLRARVIDVFESEGFHHALLNVSASAHMPDTLEMPYRADVFKVGSIQTEGRHPAVLLDNEQYELGAESGEKTYTYRLGAPTCLAGDIIGDYSFDAPLQVDDELVFDDMAHYTTVKTTFFNGVKHPDIVLQANNGSLKQLRHFTYQDFKNKLG